MAFYINPDIIKTFSKNTGVWVNFLNERKKSINYIYINLSGIDRHYTEKCSADRPSGSGDYQLLYISKGLGHFTLSGNSFQMNKGEFIIIGPDTPQQYSYSPKDKPETYWVHFDGAGVPEILERLGFLTDNIYKMDLDADTIELFDSIISSGIMKYDNYNLEAAGFLLALLTRLSQSIQNNNIDSNYLKIIPAVKYIENNCTENDSVEYYASLCNLSPSRFTHLFTEHIGIPPSRYKQILRINNAKRLLQHTSRSIKEISFALGYHDPLYFSKAFKLEAGCSPKEYRKRQL